MFGEIDGVHPERGWLLKIGVPICVSDIVIGGCVLDKSGKLTN